MAGRRRTIRVAAAAALLVVMTVAAYGPALGAGFIWDDDDYVTANPTLGTVHGLWRIWFELGAVPQYYPLVHTSYWLEHHLWGDEPLGYHAVNIALHAASAILLYLLLRRLSVPGAWLAGAVFTLHPVMVESVAWVTERKNTLSMLCYLAAMLAYQRYRRFDDRGRAGLPRYWGLAFALFVLALLAKTVTCTLPAAILLLIWFARGRIRLWEAVEMVPFAVTGAALGLLTVDVEKLHVGASGAAWSLTATDRVLVAGRALWFYAAKLVWPAGLSFIYPRWRIDPAAWSAWLYPLGVVAVVLALWLARRRLGRGPLTSVLCFAGTLAPALGFFAVYPMRYSFVADHFQYLAAPGLIALGAALVVRAFDRFGPAGAWLGRAGAALLLTALAVSTWRQGHVYRDVETLWQTTLASNSSAWIAHNNLATLLLGQRRPEEAITHCRAALAIDPELVEAHTNLGSALRLEGRPSEAVASLETALRLDPQHPPALASLGGALEELGDLDRAADVLRLALLVAPQEVGVRLNRGRVLAGLGRTGEAIDEYRAVLRLAPGEPTAHFQLGVLLAAGGELEAASRHLDKAVRLGPDDTDARVGAAQVRALRGDAAGALAGLREASRRDPGAIGARLAEALILSTHPDASVRDGERAVALAERVCEETRYQQPQALEALAAAYAEVGHYREAVALAESLLDRLRRVGLDRWQGRVEAELTGYRAGRAWRQPNGLPALAPAGERGRQGEAVAGRRRRGPGTRSGLE